MFNLTEHFFLLYLLVNRPDHSLTVAWEYSHGVCSASSVPYQPMREIKE